MNRGGEPAKIALGLLKLTVPIFHAPRGVPRRDRGLTRIARPRGIALATTESIRQRLSAGENGHASPDTVYAALLRAF